MYQTVKAQLRQYAQAAAKQSGIVLAGDVTAKALTFAISLLVMALVSPEEYIVFGLFISVLALVSQFADAGLNQSFIRFYALYAESHPGRASAHLRLALRIKILASLAAGAMLVFAAPYLAGLLEHPELTDGLRLLGAGLAGIGLFEFFQAVFQARQEFRKLTLVRVTEALVKLLVIVAFMLGASFTLMRAYQAYVFVPAMLAVVLFVFMPSLRAAKAQDREGVGKELFGFGRWLAVTAFASMFLQHLDVLMIAPMLENIPGEAGLYYAAKKFCTPVNVVTISLVTVFYPKAMELKSVQDMKDYVKNTLRVSVPAAGLMLVYFCAVAAFVPEIFPRYADAVPIAAILFAGWLWTLLGNPVTVLMLGINRAEMAMAISLVQLGVTAILLYYFITWFGALGAAAANVIVWFMAGSVSLWYIYRHRHEIENVQAGNR